MKKNTKLALALLGLLAVIGLFAGLYLTSRPDTAPGFKSVTVAVVHSDKSQRNFRYETTKEYLGDLLLSEGLIKGDPGPYGLYITEVDREVADYSVNRSYWALFIDDEYATQSADLTPLTQNGVYSLVYTVG